MKPYFLPLLLLTTITLTGCTIDHTVQLNIDEDGDGQREHLTIDIETEDENITTVTVKKDKDRLNITPPPFIPEEVQEPTPISPPQDVQKRMDFIRGLQSYLEMHYLSEHAYPIAVEPLQLKARGGKCLGKSGFTLEACDTNEQVRLYTAAPEGFFYTYQSKGGTDYQIGFFIKIEEKEVFYMATPSGIAERKLTEFFDEVAPLITPEMKRDTQRLTDIRRIQTALELHYVDNLAYPMAPSPLVLGQDTAACLNLKGLVSATADCSYAYIKKVPTDPMSPEKTYTYYAPTPNTYRIDFMLESDSGKLKAGNVQATPSGISNIALSNDK